MEWALISSNSWPASPCSEDRQPERRADQGGAGGVYSGALAVSGIHFLIPEFPDFELIRRIWNTYKDEFARTRRRELNIID
jgi:hypothetical protein